MLGIPKLGPLLQAFRAHSSNPHEHPKQPHFPHIIRVDRFGPAVDGNQYAENDSLQVRVMARSSPTALLWPIRCRCSEEEGVPDIAERMKPVIEGMLSAYQLAPPNVLTVRYAARCSYRGEEGQGGIL